MGTYLSKDLKELKMLVILQFMEAHSNRGKRNSKETVGVCVACSRNNEEVSASSVMGSVGGD